MFISAPLKICPRASRGAEKIWIVRFQTPVSEYRKSANMAEILAAVATKIAVALVEAIVLRLVWQLWSACSQSLRTAFAPVAS